MTDETPHQARRLAQKARLQRLARQILRDAKIVARWRKKPFYID